MNFIIKAPNRQPFFYKSIDTSGIPQNAVAIGEEIIKVIEEVGSEKFSSVITDNAAVMQAAWKIIEARFDTISAYGCAAHGMNLLIKDIVMIPEFTKTSQDASKIIQFINNHHIAHAKFASKRKEAGVSHKLTTSVPTRWYSEYTSAKNLLDAKTLLNRLANEDFDELSNINPKPKSKKALEIIKSANFWSRLENFCSVLKLSSKMIGK